MKLNGIMSGEHIYFYFVQLTSFVNFSLLFISVFFSFSVFNMFKEPHEMAEDDLEDP